MAKEDGDKEHPLDRLWNLVVKAIPGVSALGGSFLAKTVPWFGWLIFVGFVDSLDARVLGGFTHLQYQTLAAEGLRQSIILLLRSPWILMLTLSVLFLLALHVSTVPPSKEARQEVVPSRKDAKDKGVRTDEEAKEAAPHTHEEVEDNPGHASHDTKDASGGPSLRRAERIQRGTLTKRYYDEYYYPATAVLFIALYVLMVFAKWEWLPTTLMLGFAVAIPLYSFRHGFKGDNRMAFTYVTLLLVLVLAMGTYPYLYGKVLYRPELVRLVPKDEKELPQVFAMILDPPRLDFTIACQRGRWLVDFGSKLQVEGDRKEPYRSLTEFPFRCVESRFVQREYSLPEVKTQKP